MEIWDGYFKDGTIANIDLVRGEPVPDGLYHLVCEALVRHTDGDYLLMQRDLEKDIIPGTMKQLQVALLLKVKMH